MQYKQLPPGTGFRIEKPGSWLSDVLDWEGPRKVGIGPELRALSVLKCFLQPCTVVLHRLGSAYVEFETGSYYHW